MKSTERPAIQEISTPVILSRKLWEKAGTGIIIRTICIRRSLMKKDYAIKPMNCPGGILVYKTKVHSYKGFACALAS